MDAHSLKSWEGASSHGVCSAHQSHDFRLPRASWDERFGLKEIAEVFLLGVKAGADLFANIKVNLPDVSPDKTTRAETDLQETSSSGDR
jgi:hypothetical protein